MTQPQLARNSETKVVTQKVQKQMIQIYLLPSQW